VPERELVRNFRAVKLHVLGLVHDTHAAAIEPFEDQVMGDSSTR